MKKDNSLLSTRGPAYQCSQVSRYEQIQTAPLTWILSYPHTNNHKMTTKAVSFLTSSLAEYCTYQSLDPQQRCPDILNFAIRTKHN